MTLGSATKHYLDRGNFPELMAALKDRGYALVGPTVRDDAIVYQSINTSDDFPVSTLEQQSAGSYKLVNSDTNRWFDCTNSAQGLKPLLFKPREYLWQVQRDADGKLSFQSERNSDPAIAFIAARACDIQALALQDAHFIQDRTPDPFYSDRRAKLMIIAVNCSRSAETCFCAATGDGPKIKSGFDLCLTELEDGFVVEIGSTLGQKLLTALHLPQASETQVQQAEQQTRNAAAMQKRTMPTQTLSLDWLNNLDSTVWQDMENRCLACGSCTSVCPTCFCHRELEDANIDGNSSRHYRQWSSCFTEEHSYMHGIVFRPDIRLRYRQWFTHKLATWHEQYGRSGCVGCGRCITWCPVGIDITELAHRFTQPGDTNNE